MIQRIGVLVVLAFCMGVTGQAANVPEEPEDVPDHVVRRLTPPPVVRVEVDTPSKRANLGNENSDCSGFALKPHHVRRFLKRAQAVSGRDYDHYHPWGQCRASGTVRFANGMRASWHIESAGRGVLMPTNGKRKETLYFLYCEDCEGMGWSR